MKIGIQTWGSQGDIFPFIALANGLARAGHEVTLAYTSIENKDYAGHAQHFRMIRIFDAFEDADQLIPNAIRQTSMMKQLKYLVENAFNPAQTAMFEASCQLCAENEVVIGHLMCHTLSVAAEKSGCPRVSVALTSNAVYSRYTSVFGKNLGVWLNQLSWLLSDWVGQRLLFKKAAELRRSLGMPVVKSVAKEVILSRDLTLIATSPSLTPRFSDWDDSICITGFWSGRYGGDTWQMPDILARFLAAGPAPIYLTFGSMGDLTAKSTLELHLAAARQLGRRCIIQSSLSSESQHLASEHIFITGNLPHHLIFPKCALLVHHGGAGTTQASLLAGIPSVVVEYGFDQKYWGATLHNQGVTHKVLSRRDVTPEALAAEIEIVLSTPNYRRKAEALSPTLTEEDGVATAVNAIERRFASRA